jgi:copper oxidase (laccase) domain-containing protein
MMQTPCYLKQLVELPNPLGVRADFVGRIPGVAVDRDKGATLSRLRSAHEAAVRDLGFEWSELHLAEQVHGVGIVVVGRDSSVRVNEGVDGLITADAGVLLGIYVADCGAVYISDPVKGVLALLHSGKKGTEGNITGNAIALMQSRFGCCPEDLRVALAPCIRPPAYEVDFASQIRIQALEAGVLEAHYEDSGVCTTSDPEAYYSYRMKKGATGRMLALLGRRESA